MKCTYHRTADSGEFCHTCSNPLCAQCAHQIKGKIFCQDCLVAGAEWAATVKGRHFPADSPKRAAICSLIPGMGAVYNSEYLKAITYFAVFAALIVMGSDVHEIFGFGAFAFLIFTIFDSYRTAETRARQRLESGIPPKEQPTDITVIGWGIFLIILGCLFLAQSLFSFFFLRKLWPLVFIFLGAYLVYRYLHDRREAATGLTDKAT